jgi:hypothetical protein
MFTTLRKFTVIFLAILQLIAPLVHAHVGENIGSLPNSGLGSLHVPGLEIYSVDRDISISRIKTFHGNAFTRDACADGMLIDIGTGIKDKQFHADLDDSPYLHQQAASFKTAISSFDTTTPPQLQQFVARLLIPSLSPRAPPAQ